MKRRLKEEKTDDITQINSLKESYNKVIADYLKTLEGKYFGGEDLSYRSSTGKLHFTGDRIIDDLTKIDERFYKHYQEDFKRLHIRRIDDFEIGIPKRSRTIRGCKIFDAPIVGQYTKKIYYNIYYCSDQQNIIKAAKFADESAMPWPYAVDTVGYLDGQEVVAIPPAAPRRLREYRKGKIMKITLKELKNLIKEAVYENRYEEYRDLKSREFELSTEEQEELDRLRDQLFYSDTPSGEEYDGDHEPLEAEDRYRAGLWASPSERARRRRR